ncbi:hypothetical protein MTP99_014648 [Tenebrio molitor]|jgi:ferritin heavy chain|nr:hypothetical protein MTP99_014648 [Tenebrio molitor]CAH1373224.1 unnamed protein product [Tenebrio molitor]
MKAIVASTLLLCTFALANGDQLQCSHTEQEIKTDPNWTDMKRSCINSMRTQIRAELSAAMQYLAMGAHFSKDTINRPGFAKMFFDSASEERQHAIKLISYLLMRGELISDVSNLIDTYIGVSKTQWESGVEALKDALQLEATVTKKIKGVVKVCEDQPGPNDYHLVDYLTGVFLEEQYTGQRDIAGKISTLDKFMTKHGALGEFLFDKKLLNGEL